jgi:hypothetical protein
MALKLAEDSLPAYAHPNSPKKFTQHQLFACLVLKEFLNNDYRGVVIMLQECGDLREAIGLKQAPHFTTLQKASDRLLQEKETHQLLEASLAEARRRKLLPKCISLAAIDASGFSARRISRYFSRRCGQDTPGKRPTTTSRHFPKMAILADCASHLILAIHFEQGPGPDITHARSLRTKSLNRLRVTTLAADAGYDAEWMHEFVRETFGVRLLVPPRIGKATGKPPKTRYRRWMYSHLHHTRYSQRWQVETVFSMLKRRLTETLSAKSEPRERRAANLKALAHNILILWRVELFYRAT